MVRSRRPGRSALPLVHGDLCSGVYCRSASVGRTVTVPEGSPGSMIIGQSNREMPAPTRAFDRCRYRIFSEGRRKQGVSAPWDWPGSRWWRVDLHCRSPASHDFRPEQASSSPDWIGWVEAARDAGLHAVAVTDHNSAAGIDHLQRVATQVENAPVLFPGVELTAADGCHLLLLMDRLAQQHTSMICSPGWISL